MAQLLYANAVVGGMIASGGFWLQVGLPLVFGTGCIGLTDLIAPYRMVLVTTVALIHSIVVSIYRPSWSTRVYSCVLLCVLLVSPAIVRGTYAFQLTTTERHKLDLTTLYIRDMSCLACRLAVKFALESVAGVRDCVVERTGRTMCFGKVADVSILLHIVRGLGYGCNAVRLSGEQMSV
jgi:copper chaperone CopZ